MKKTSFSEFIIDATNPDIRYRYVTETTMFMTVNWVEFEVHRRRFFFGCFGKKRWISAGKFSSVEFGMKYSENVLNNCVAK